MKVFLNRFSSAKPKGPGVPWAGAGALVSCLTTLMGRARNGTLSGTPQTAAAKYPSGASTLWILDKAPEGHSILFRPP
jgi:hypothetical protein